MLRFGVLFNNPGVAEILRCFPVPDREVARNNYRMRIKKRDGGMVLCVSFG